jgi:hypothetical protein
MGPQITQIKGLECVDESLVLQRLGAEAERKLVLRRLVLR